MKRGKKFLLLPRGERGQFYIAAAIILAAVVIGFATFSNVLEKEKVSDFDEISEELTIEMQRIYDSGLESGFDEDEINENLENFAEVYANSSTIDMDFYFIFGDEDGLIVSGYQESDELGVEVESVIATLPETTQIEFNKNKYIVSSENYKPLTDGTVKLKIDNVSYPFEISKGKNLHFVIYYEKEGEKYIITK